MNEDANVEPTTANGFALSGCTPVRVPLTEIAGYEYRYEYWDAETETAWEVRDNSPRHEEPCGRFVELVKDIGKMRGQPVAVFGGADLQERDAEGARLRSVQPDGMVYLSRPYTIPRTIVVKRDFPLPDVVLEVDLTTDVRERKLGLYESWGVAELWVEVPDAPMRSKRRRPGLAIFVRKEGDGKYIEKDESVAFPTWSAREIHEALNEPFTSAATVAALRRVGETMGRLSGTGPDDDPFLRVERKLSRSEGLREGIEQERLSLLKGLLATRGIDLAGRLPDAAEWIATMPQEPLLQAALQCRDADDFLRRIGTRA